MVPGIIDIELITASDNGSPIAVASSVSAPAPTATLAFCARRPGLLRSAAPEGVGGHAQPALYL